MALSSTNFYDDAMRVTGTVDEAGIETKYSYDLGGRETSVVRAGVTNATMNYRDGQAKYATRNGVTQTYYLRGANADGTQWATTWTGPNGTNSAMKVTTVTDMLGRTIREERPGFGGVTLTNYFLYNCYRPN